MAATGPGLTVVVAYGNDPDQPLTVGVIRQALNNLPAGWADLPADTPAAQCYLRRPPLIEEAPGATGIDSVVVTPGLAPLFYDHTHPDGGLYESLSDPHN